MEDKIVRFEKNFIFGVATSSYQIEGAATEDGRSPLIWDTFCKTPGKVYEGHTGDVACDHYHRYKEDVKILKELELIHIDFQFLGLEYFRSMVSIIRKGWSFKKLINELIRNNIEPTVTLFHWDLPMWAYNMGGWLNRDSIKWFQEYSVKVFEELNDSVKFWTTHNEPFCASILGYYFGIHAPGHKNTREALIAAHHILLSHGAAVEVFREFGFKDSKIGIILNLTPFYPVSDSKEDIEASYRCDGLSNRWFLDPIFKASYPEDMKKVLIKPAGEFDFINPKGRIPRACPWMNVKFARRASSEARKVEKLPRTCPWGFHKRWRFTKNIN